MITIHFALAQIASEFTLTHIKMNSSTEVPKMIEEQEENCGSGNAKYYQMTTFSDIAQSQLAMDRLPKTKHSLEQPVKMSYSNLSNCVEFGDNMMHGL